MKSYSIGPAGIQFVDNLSDDDYLLIEEELKDIESRIDEMMSRNNQLQETTMTAPPPRGPAPIRPTHSVNDNVKLAIKRGAIRGGAGAAHRHAIEKLLVSLGPNVPPAVKTEAGKRVLEFMTAYIMLQLLESPLGEKVPRRQDLSEVFNILIEEVASTGAGNIVDSFVEIVVPMLGEYLAAIPSEDNQLEDKAVDLTSLFENISLKEKVAV